MLGRLEMVLYGVLVSGEEVADLAVVGIYGVYELHPYNDVIGPKAVYAMVGVTVTLACGD